MGMPGARAAAPRDQVAAVASRRWRLAGVPGYVRRYPLGACSATVFLLIVAVALLAPVISPYNPYAISYTAIRLPPSHTHLLGTDEIGRDVLSRVFYAMRISLVVGCLSVLLGCTAGTAVGLLSGYSEGVADLVLVRLIEVVMAFPALILALTIISIAGPSTANTVYAIAIVFVPYAARTVRSSVLATKHNAYIEAARVVGCGSARILIRHITPNVLAPIIIIASVQLANAIIVEASLSFLGLGTRPPSASLGTMLSQAMQYPARITSWLVYSPGIAIAIIVLCTNLAGDALRDTLDPRLRKGKSIGM